MITKFSTVVLLIAITKSAIAAQVCPYASKPSLECPPLDDLKDFAWTSTSIESLYNRYVNLLTNAKLTISGYEPGVNLFFAGELSQKVRKLKYYGNSITTFLEISLHHVCQEYGLTPQEFLHCVKQLNVTADYFEICEHIEHIDCSERSLVYQPVDGICVNSENPYRGAINTPYRRLIKNSYEDSIHEVRSSVHEHKIPSTRLLSSGLKTLNYPIHFESDENVQNDLVLFFASAVSFDIAKTLKAQTWNGNFGFECCECDGRTKISPRFTNRHCMPIDIPDRDPVFKGAKCMNYIRAMVTHDNCQLKEASILNHVSHYLDMDFLYVPNNIKRAIKIDGKFIDTENSMHRTVILGDERSAMFPQAFSIAVVWIKFHNVVVDELKKLYPTIPVDVRFYEARRFVIAVYQSIVYSEVLPELISPRSMIRYRLNNKRYCYDPDIDPSVSVEFTSSTARYFHKFIQNAYVVNFKNGQKEEILLRDLKNEALGYTELAGVITGLMNRTWNTLNIADEPSNYLFTADGRPGLDLKAIDLQTERDFGVGTYCDALFFFNMTKGQCISSFSDFSPYINDTIIKFLEYAYDKPCDVDFGVGASMHSSEDGDWLSEIFDRIFATQFRNLKCGDPYFYTNSLSADQIDIVESISFSDILCLTIPDLPPIQPYAFITPGVNNTVRACSKTLNLEGWKLLTDPISNVKLPTIPPEDVTKFEEPVVKTTHEPKTTSI